LGDEGMEQDYTHLGKKINIFFSSDELDEETLKLANYLFTHSCKEEIEKFEPPKLLFNFLVEGGINFIVGKGGEGKTHLLLHIAINLKREGYRVFYLDFDNGRGFIKTRESGEIPALAEIDENYLFYFDIAYLNDLAFSLGYTGKDKNFKLINAFSKLLEYFAKNGEKPVLIIDTFQKVVGQTIDEKRVIPFMDLLRDIASKGITVILLHHTTKQTERTIYKGSTAISDLSDMVWYISSIKEKNVITGYYLLAEKTRYLAPDKLMITLGAGWQFSVSESFIEDAGELRVLKELFRLFIRYGELKQQEIWEKIENKDLISRNALFEVLKKYTEGEKAFFRIRKGSHNAKFYSINLENFEIVEKAYKQIFGENLPFKVKQIKKLYDLAISLEGLIFKPELHISCKDGYRVFQNIEDILKNIWVIYLNCWKNIPSLIQELEFATVEIEDLPELSAKEKENNTEDIPKKNEENVETYIENVIRKFEEEGKVLIPKNLNRETYKEIKIRIAEHWDFEEKPNGKFIELRKVDPDDLPDLL
jgi:archaellum biogenesis ATPase FlaH